MTSEVLRVLLVTDSFPPGSGGSGWSTFELARQLQRRGHDVSVVHASAGMVSSIETSTYDTLPVIRYRMRVPNVPALRNVLKNERLWAGLARFLVARCTSSPVDVIHAQHVMTTVPAVRAARRLGVPVIATVRDYWPVCYWSDLIVDVNQRTLCPACTVSGMRACTRSRAGALGPVGWGLIPYMRRNLATKQRALADADAVIGVSSVITADLLARAPALDATRVHTIPNPVNMDDLDERTTSDLSPCVLYAGKLAPNKGVQFLLPAMDAAGIRWPLVVAGDGPSRAALEADARRRDRTVQWLGWCDRPEVLDWMRRATLLAFPSYGPESLSRVLIEASALGLPIAAMNTGGTGDILEHDITGLVSDSPETFARDLARLAGDADLRARLGRAAAQHARAHFAADAVAARVEDVYRQVLYP
jgi:glycosyltransferase involved in cell wall biosynthesis